MKNIYRTRISKLAKLLKAESENSCLMICSASEKIKSGDQHFPYKQDNNFFYLTGSQIKNCILIIKSDGDATLIAKPSDPKLVVWEGEQEDPKKLAGTLGVDLLINLDPASLILSLLSISSVLFRSYDKGSILDNLLKRFAIESRKKLPSRIVDANEIFAKLRLTKDVHEINAIKGAIQITGSTLELIQDLLTPGVKEFEIKAAIDYYFAVQKSEPAFETIVASGKSAATLHYNKHDRTLKKGDLVLIDLGASFYGYAADISRTYVVGECGGIESDLYLLVRAMQEAAISKVKAGVTMRSVHLAAVSVLAQGLKDLKILTGSLDEIISKRKYFEYFPHSIGHSLGLDVHDISLHRGNPDAKLEQGMVITIEPGIYFNKAIKKVPACGIRIEDDILVAKSSATVLSKAIPK